MFNLDTINMGDTYDGSKPNYGGGYPIDYLTNINKYRNFEHFRMEKISNKIKNLKKQLSAIGFKTK